MNIVNLKDETIEKIHKLNKIEADVDYVATLDGSLTFDEFKEMADFEYNSGFGAEEIRLDLSIVFKDGTWLGRFEYDGAEEWVYHSLPKKKKKKIKTLRAYDND